METNTNTSDTEFIEDVQVYDHTGTPAPPQCIEASKHELISEYGVTLPELNMLEKHVEAVSTDVITNVFNADDVDGLDTGTTLIYRQVLADIVAMINEKHWPVTGDAYVFNNLFDAIHAETPKEYIDNLTTALQAGNDDSHRYIDAKISRIHQHTKQSSVIDRYVNCLGVKP
jgi:hypothetical protein